MSRGYKRRQKGLKRGTWETANDRSARVWSEFADSVEAEIRRLEAMPPEQLEAIRQQFKEARHERAH